MKPFYPEPREDGRGRPSFHPVLMLKVLVFGYSISIRSSRKLDRLLERDIAFRYLAANQQPDFRTISNFRKTIAKSSNTSSKRFCDSVKMSGLPTSEKSPWTA